MTYRGGGYYAASLPGHASQSRIAFYLQATDLHASPATTRFPDNAPNRECAIQFGEEKFKGNFGVYRLWLTDRDGEDLERPRQARQHPIGRNVRLRRLPRHLQHGRPLRRESIHLARLQLADRLALRLRVHLPRGRSLPQHDRFHHGLSHPRRSAQLEHVALWMLDRLGGHGGYRRFVNLAINGNRRGNIYEDCLQPNGDVVDAQFPSDADGDLYKIDDWFEFNDAVSSFNNIDASLQKFTTSGNVKKAARYRWNWRKRAVARSASDYTSLLTLVDAMNPRSNDRFTDSEYATLNGLMDIGGWMRVFAMERIAANWDSYGYSRGEEHVRLQAPERQMGSFGPGTSTSRVRHRWPGRQRRALFGSSDPTMTRLMNHAPARRLYLQALKEAAEGPMAATAVAERMDALAAGLKANGVSVSATTGSKNWISQRRDYILGQLQPYAAAFCDYQQ